MAKTTAQNKQQVDEMTPQQRLWDSLSYSYGKQAEASDQSYDKAISQLNNSLLARGMQRSSYGASINANLYNQKINAANDIGSQQIADYENRLYQLEKDEDERAYRDKAFDEQVRQYDEGFAYQKEQDALNQAFQREQFEYGKDSDDRKYAYELALSMIQNGKTPSDDLLASAGISKEDVATLVGNASNNGSVITWRQTEDAKAKALGYTGRNDPNYIARNNGVANYTTSDSVLDSKLSTGYQSGSNTGSSTSALGAFFRGYNDGKIKYNEYNKTAKK